MAEHPVIELGDKKLILPPIIFVKPDKVVLVRVSLTGFRSPEILFAEIILHSINPAPRISPPRGKFKFPVLLIVVASRVLTLETTPP
jgi:hypothetical protein